MNEIQAFEKWMHEEYGFGPDDDRAFCAIAQLKAWRAAVVWMWSRQEPIAEYTGVVGEHYTINLDNWKLPKGSALYAYPGASAADRSWAPIEYAPRDGSEFVAANINQGFCKRLVSWNTIHGFWQSKGESINLVETHWASLPVDLQE